MSDLTPTTEAPDRDAGLTLIEILIVMVVLGVITSVLSVAVTTTLRVAPDTETRLDDARATRGLATWLASDTISTPPFMPEQAQGGIVLDQDPIAPNNNDCGALGTNLLHLQWTEVTYSTLTVVANYRFVNTGTDALIIRSVCSSTNGGPFTSITERTITSGLEPTQIPTITPTLHPITGDVTSITFELIGEGGELVRIETGSRNPAEFFP